jgi:large subunit ribosomal protein L17
MRHNKTLKKLDRNRAGRTALFRTQAISLITYKSIVTTKAKAKALRPAFEKLITKATKNTLATHRLLLQRLNNEKAVQELMAVIAPKCKERPGGYTRIVPLGNRVGDGAEEVQLEIIL